MRSRSCGSCREKAPRAVRELPAESVRPEGLSKALPDNSQGRMERLLQRGGGLLSTAGLFWFLSQGFG